MIIYSAVFFSLGIIAAYIANMPFWPVYILEIVILAFCIRLRRYKISFTIFLSVFVLLLGALYSKNARILRQTDISRYIYYKSGTVYGVWGYISDQPEYHDGEVKFFLAARSLSFNGRKYNCSGTILARAKSLCGLAYGEEVFLSGNIYFPGRFRPSGISGVMQIKTPAACVRLQANKGNIIKRFAFFLKAKAQGILYGRLSPLAAGILDAMVLGEKKNIPSVLYDSMVRSGTVHILVVSGFNVGVVAFVVMVILKIMRFAHRIRCLLTAGSLIVYCFATGASVPVVRATLMGVFFLAGYLIKRDPDIYNSLSLAALTILLCDPGALFSVSFQLSFCSVLAIVLIYPRIKAFFRLERITFKPFRFVAEGCAVSLSAWAGTFLFILYYFKIFSPVTVLANVVIVPLATLITLSGFSLLFASLALPVLTPYFAATSELLVVLLLHLNRFFIQLPFAYFYI